MIKQLYIFLSQFCKICPFASMLSKIKNDEIYYKKVMKLCRRCLFFVFEGCLRCCQKHRCEWSEEYCRSIGCRFCDAPCIREWPQRSNQSVISTY